MNERIKELAIEAFFDEDTNVVSDKIYTFNEEKMQKFALLIVQGNIQTLRGNGYDDAAQVLQDIHFGIEDPV